MVQSEKNHLARKKHESLSKVCVIGFKFTSFPHKEFNHLLPIYWLVAGYSGSHAEVVGSVLVSNLKTGIRKGGWDRAEVQVTCTCNLFNLCFFLITENKIFNTT